MIYLGVYERRMDCSGDDPQLQFCSHGFRAVIWVVVATAHTMAIQLTQTRYREEQYGCSGDSPYADGNSSSIKKAFRSRGTNASRAILYPHMTNF